MAAHDAVNRRWLDYELDVGKLIDFPVMTDVREPFLQSHSSARRKRRTVCARPPRATSRRRPGWLSTGRPSTPLNWPSTSRSAKPSGSRTTTSVRWNASACRRPGNCSTSPSTTPRHQPNGKPALKRARRELDGLIVLPEATVAALEAEDCRRTERTARLGVTGGEHDGGAPGLCAGGVIVGGSAYSAWLNAPCPEHS